MISGEKEQLIDMICLLVRNYSPHHGGLSSLPSAVRSWWDENYVDLKAREEEMSQARRREEDRLDGVKKDVLAGLTADQVASLRLRSG